MAVAALVPSCRWQVAALALWTKGLVVAIRLAAQTVLMQMPQVRMLAAAVAATGIAAVAATAMAGMGATEYSAREAALEPVAVASAVVTTSRIDAARTAVRQPEAFPMS